MPGINRLTLLLLMLLAFTITTSLATLQRQEQSCPPSSQKKSPSRDREGADFDSQFPVADYDATDVVADDKQSHRKAKNKRYDRSGMVSGLPADEKVIEAVLDIPWRDSIAAIPAAQSLAIVIGEAQKAEAFLSNNKSGVYTETVIRIEEVLKNDGSGQLAANNTIDVDRPGGFVKYPNGYKRLYRVFGMNMPRIGRRYVLFLVNPDQGENYRVLTGYELNTSGVSPLDIAPQFDTYKGADKESFLKAVRDAIAQSSVTEPKE